MITFYRILVTKLHSFSFVCALRATSKLISLHAFYYNFTISQSNQSQTLRLQGQWRALMWGPFLSTPLAFVLPKVPHTDIWLRWSEITDLSGSIKCQPDNLCLNLLLQISYLLRTLCVHGLLRESYCTRSVQGLLSFDQCSSPPWRIEKSQAPLRRESKHNMR